LRNRERKFERAGGESSRERELKELDREFKGELKGRDSSRESSRGESLSLRERESSRLRERERENLKVRESSKRRESLLKGRAEGKTQPEG
jgi:hypothetical protein